MKRLILMANVLVVASMLLSACATPTPEVIEKVITKEVEKVVTQVVKETVKETVIVEGTPKVVEKEVTKIVEKVVTPTPAGGPKLGGEIVMADMETNTLNPYIASEAIARGVIALINRGLVGIGPDGKWFPAMAAEVPTLENGGISEDGKTITWRLRPGLKWSDGTPLTSDDVKFTWEAVSHPESTATQTQGFYLIEDVETPDELTAVVHYEEFYVAWVTQFALGLLPSSAGEPAGMGEWEWNRTANPTNGPFIVTEWVASDHMIFERNPHWWEEGKPYLDKIYYPIVAELETQRQMLLAGENDAHHWLSKDYIEMMEDAGMTVKYSSSPYWKRIQFKLSEFGDDRPSPPAKPHVILGDPKVREALTYSFNREEICYDYLEPIFPLSMFFKGDFNCEDELKALNPHEYDPERCKAMLEEAGWKDEDGDGIRECHGCMYAEEGTPMRMAIGGFSGWGQEDNQAVMVENLKAVGVDSFIQNVEATVLYGTYGEGSPARRGEFDILYWDYELGADPHSKAEDFYATWRIPNEENPGGFNCTRISDPEIDEWMKTAGSTPDVATRHEAYCNIAKKITTEIYSELSLGMGMSSNASSPRLKGWESNETYMPFSVYVWDAENWYIEE
jgi:peptide/nickel transport system substrate-binding protein